MEEVEAALPRILISDDIRTLIEVIRHTIAILGPRPSSRQWCTRRRARHRRRRQLDASRKLHILELSFDTLL